MTHILGEEGAREAKGAYTGTQPYRFAETLWRLAQVQPNAKLGFRSGIREFVVDIDTEVQHHFVADLAAVTPAPVALQFAHGAGI